MDRKLEWEWLEILGQLARQARSERDYEAMEFYRAWWNGLYLRYPEKG